MNSRLPEADDSSSTERQAERQARKMEAIGRLASGVAHEINTPVQFVSSNLHFLKTSFTDMQMLLVAYREALASAGEPGAVDQLEQQFDSEFLEEQIPIAIDQALDGVERVARIIRAMREFGHPDGEMQASADINELILSTLSLARNEWKYVSRVETCFEELPRVKCFAGEISQVVLNLVVNAAHAIADKGEQDHGLGNITISTHLEGDNVAVSVADTGTGIPDELVERIYDPFFTTKEAGRGTGQGLPMVKAFIVSRHGGTLTLQTQAGAGTTFTFRIPVEGLRVVEDGNGA
jgi:signal transduction histidine kinase